MNKYFLKMVFVTSVSLRSYTQGIVIWRLWSLRLKTDAAVMNWSKVWRILFQLQSILTFYCTLSSLVYMFRLFVFQPCLVWTVCLIADLFLAAEKAVGETQTCQHDPDFLSFGQEFKLPVFLCKPFSLLSEASNKELVLYTLCFDAPARH